MNKLTKYTLQSGFILFAYCSLLSIIKMGFLLLLAVYFLPGLMFGLIISSFYKGAKDLLRITFTLGSIIIYTLCIYIVDLKEYDEINSSIRLIVASIIGAILLTVIFDLTINFNNVKLRRSFFNPLLIGFLSAIPSAFCIYFLEDIKYDQPIIESLVYCGIFIIFPLWQLLFVVNIKKGVDKTMISKNE